MEEGLDLAKSAVQSGKARDTLKRWAELSETGRTGMNARTPRPILELPSGGWKP